MERFTREGILWRKCEGGPEGFLECLLCSHRCRLAPGKKGICGVRENREGTLFTLVYARVAAKAVDPIEKKPLYHFLPGSLTYSIATCGCNFDCDNCQNFTLSQSPKAQRLLYGEFLSPRDAVAEALESGSKSISYTYSEPTVFMEYALEVMERGKAAGLLNVFVTNGYMTREAILALEGLLDAANVDLKSCSDAFYKKVCKGRVGPVLDSIAELRSRGVWVELTTLLIPGFNDSDSEIRQIAAFIKSLDRGIPWHISGFFPTYRMGDVPPTTAESLERARLIGLGEGLDFVYNGNRPIAGAEDTICPGCAKTLIKRRGFRVEYSLVDKDGLCPFCASGISGLFWRN